MDFQNTLNEILPRYALPGALTEAVPFGSGHINDTLRLTFQTPAGPARYVLQRLNTSIFKTPAEVMANTVAVTEHLKRKIASRGGDPDRETLTVIRTAAGQSFVKTGDGGFWRMTRFIENAVSYDEVTDPEIMAESGRAFGRFQKDLADIPLGGLYDVLPDFHNTYLRLTQFEAALGADGKRRAAGCAEEIAYIKEHTALALKAREMCREAFMPRRVTHNDTKINNVMFDKATGRAVCVIDLDTVMPGYVLYDFGDAIRTGAITGAEDEPDINKVGFSLERFEAFARGFFEQSAGSLTAGEKESLLYAAPIIAYEQSLRFLADYLAGDPYYKTDYPEHNLVRTRTQIKLLRELEKAKKDTDGIIGECLER